MGTYDTIVYDNAEHQTKALGKGMQRYSIGDSVTVEYVSRSTEQYELAPTHQYAGLPEQYAFEATDDVLFLVEGGILVGVIDADVAESITVFDYYGANAGIEPTIAADPVWQSIRRTTCRRAPRPPISEALEAEL